MEEVERQEKIGSGLAGAQDLTWFQVLNPSDTNEVINGICSNHADTSLSDYFRLEEEGNKEADEGERKSVAASVNVDDSKMDQEDDSNTLENGEHAVENTVRTSHKTA